MGLHFIAISLSDYDPVFMRIQYFYTSAYTTPIFLRRSIRRTFRFWSYGHS